MQDFDLMPPEPPKRGRRAGSHLSEETKQKIAASRLGKRHTESTKEKIAVAKKGKPSVSSTKFKPGERPSPATEFKPGQIPHNLKPEDHSWETKQGYRYVRFRDGNKRFRFEHLVMAEKVLGRRLQPGEDVHHLNGRKQDNRNSNFLICTSAYHRFIENAMGYIYKRQYFGGLSHEDAVADFHATFGKGSKGDLSRPSRQGRESRICPACGNTFIVGGIGNPGIDSVFCSNRECRHRGRIRQATPCLTLSKEDCAYAAELVDSMGTFTLTKSATESISVKLSIHIGPHRETIRQWLIEHTGLAKTGKYRSWQAYSSSVAELLEHILPLLKVKHRQAALALETQKRLSDPKLKADRSWQPDYIEQMHKLNAGGRWGTSVHQLSLDTSAASA